MTKSIQAQDSGRPGESVAREHTLRLADFILANMEQLLAEWETFARSIWPGIATTDPAILRDDAELVLRAAAADMQSEQSFAQQTSKSRGHGGDGAHSEEIDRVSISHGRDRLASGFDLAAVISEYRALRASVLRLWQQRMPQPHSSDLADLTRFNESIDQSLTEAVAEYSKLAEQGRQATMDVQSQLTGELRAINDALLVSSVRQNELLAQAEKDQETIAGSEREMADFFETASIGFHWVGPDGIILRANQAELDLLGYGNAGGREEYVGRHIAEFHDDQLVIEDMLARLLRGEMLRDFPAGLRSKDGSVRDVLINSSALFENGRFIHSRCFTHDITDRCRLEKIAQEQTAALANLHRRKDEFLAMLSHELRSPLAPITNAVQLLGLQQGSESPIQQQARSIIERQLGQLQHLVDDLLEVSRITTGRVQLRRKRVAVSRIVEGAVETVRPLIGQLHHELMVSLPPEPIWLDADVARLEQVVVNLLTNAAKYTADGGRIWLTVELEEDKEIGRRGDKETRSRGDKEIGRQGDGETRSSGDLENSTSVFQYPPLPISPSPHLPLSPSHVTIRVRDTGVGISPELLPHIFDLFTQADRSLDRSQGGLGIGLALVQRLTELHGGTVEAVSEPGQGSEFIVRLPLGSGEWRVASGEQKEVGHATPVSPSSLAPRPSPLAPPLHVLMVDDNVDTVLSFAMLLRALGHEVRTAHDGLAAVKAAVDYKPDVVLLDIGLPGLNGYEVAQRIRQESVLRNVMLIALTGYGQETDRQAALQAGFNHHLVKPARLKELQKILATVSHQSISRNALASGSVESGETGR